MSRIRVSVAGDRRSAALSVSAGPPVAADALATALAAAGVVHGIDTAWLEAVAPRLADPTFAVQGTIARATEPQPGRDGRMQLEFERGPLPGAHLDHDRVDYRERAFLHPVAAGATFGRLLPPEPGVPGCGVDGRPLAATPGRPAAVRLGGGVRRGNGGELVAVCDGVVATPDGAIDVLPLYEHPGDVDLHCGNLRSAGNVRVRGDVAAGFCVESGGDIDIGGSSSGGTVQAAGSVRIGTGALDGSQVLCGGDLLVRHASNATLRAAGTVRVGDELVHCRVTAGAIELRSARGHVLGGELRARGDVRVLRAGSPAGAATLLSAGDLAGEQGELVRRQQQAERTDRRARKAAAPLGGGRDGKALRQRSSADAAVVQERIELGRRQRELLRTAVVVVDQELHPGVRVQLGGTSITIDSERRGATFRWDADTGTIRQENP